MTLASLRIWLEQLAEVDATLPAGQVLARLPEEDREPEPTPTTPEPEPTWRERLWTVPSETRIGVPELAEALARSKSWIYKRTMRAASDPLPHRRLDGELVFLAGELRAWIRDRETGESGYRMDPPGSLRSVR